MSSNWNSSCLIFLLVMSTIFLLWLPFTVSFRCCNFGVTSRATKVRRWRTDGPAAYVDATRRTGPWKAPTQRHEAYVSTTVMSQSSASEASPSQSPQFSFSDNNNNQVENSSAKTLVNGEEEKVVRMELPWSDFQEWALRDHLPRYTVQIPGTASPFALWRTMSREVTELNGYPVEFLRTMHTRSYDAYNNNKAQTQQSPYQSQQNQSSDALSSTSPSRADSTGTTTTTIATNPMVPTPNILPFLDDFEFQSSGGVNGRVYGLPGVADGTRITTTPVQNIQFTLPKGFVQTIGGGEGGSSEHNFAYELGRPKDGTTVAAANISPFTLDATSLVRGLLSSKASTDGVASSDGTDRPGNDMLVQLGGLTTAVLGGALVMNMLSHHLTVNVFWV